MPYAIFATDRKHWYDGSGVTNRSSRARVYHDYDDAVAAFDQLSLDASFAVREVQLCRANGCDRIALAKGFCNTHYGQMYRGEDMHLPRDIVYVKDKKRKAKDIISSAEAERRGLVAEIAHAELNYDSVVGISDRLKWRATIRELKERLKEIDEPESPDGSIEQESSG